MQEQIPLIRKGWVRALIFLITWLILQLGMNVFAYFLLSKFSPDTKIETLNIYQQLLVQLVALLSSLGIVWVFRKNVDRKSFASLGFDFKLNRRHAYTGLYVAVFILALGSFILVAAGNLKYLGVEFDPKNLLLYLLMMLLVSVAEETVSRGYILSNLMDSFPKWVALLVSALLFSLFHFMNPAFNLMSLMGVFAGGLLLGVNYIYTRNLWFGFAYHLAWNYLQGPIMGYQVSGIEIESLLVPSIHGANWWTGGPFGFEASLLSVILNFGMAVFLYIWYQKKRVRVELATVKN